MRTILITNQYPSETNLYRNGFVHTRVKQYRDKGLDVEVYVYDNKQSKNKKYVFDSIQVNLINKESLINLIKKGKLNIIVHFAFKKYTKVILNNMNINSKLLIWVHGVEALSWKRRLFNLSFNPFSLLSFFNYIFKNTVQLSFFRKLIESQNKKNIHFVFVSNWMKKVTEEDTSSIGKIKKYSIIPNAIDTNLFSYSKKTSEDRLRIVSIRSYYSKKYANDITQEVIMKLSKEPFFNELEFYIYGSGQLFKKITKAYDKFDNVNVINTFLTQKEMKTTYDTSGVLLIPTRQDAQGVSMCEGISSGLVAVTSNNTAIPEFVDRKFGYLANNVDDMVTAIKELYNNPQIFLEKSQNVKLLRENLNEEKIINREIELIQSRIN